MIMFTLMIVFTVMKKIYAAPIPGVQPHNFVIDVMHLDLYRHFEFLCLMEPDFNGNMTFLTPSSTVECLEIYGYSSSGERFNIDYIPAA